MNTYTPFTPEMFFFVVRVSEALLLSLSLFVQIDLFAHHVRQTTLQTGSFDRDELEEIESEMSQKTRLWRGIQTFEERLETWENTSFESLDIDAMESEIVRYATIRETHILRAEFQDDRVVDSD